MAERNRVQALVPEGAEALFNRVGTAPGIWMRLGRATVACLPGIPSEMKVMFHEQVVPRLRQQGWLERVIIERKINLFGRGEVLALQLAAGNRQRSFQFSFTEPYIRNRPISAGFSVFAYSQKFFGEGTFLSTNSNAISCSQPRAASLASASPGLTILAPIPAAPMFPMRRLTRVTPSAPGAPWSPTCSDDRNSYTSD